MSTALDYFKDGNYWCLVKAAIRQLAPRAYIRGTLYEHVDQHLTSFAPYRDFRRGQISRETLHRSLRQAETALVASGLWPNLITKAVRFPVNEALYVDRILRNLVAKCIIPRADYDEAAFSRYRSRIAAAFDHGEYQTTIYPEEERLVYALSEILAPRSAIALGSYYGYWGIWALPGVRAAGGVMSFLDVDANVCAIARRNLRHFGFDDCVDVIREDAVSFMTRHQTTYDFGLLDADGAADNTDPRRRGKRIYAPMAAGFSRQARGGALLVCHNILRSNPVTDSDLDGLRDEYSLQYQDFDTAISRLFDCWAEYESTEGLGVYRVRR